MLGLGDGRLVADRVGAAVGVGLAARGQRRRRRPRWRRPGRAPAAAAGARVARCRRRLPRRRRGRLVVAEGPQGVLDHRAVARAVDRTRSIDRSGVCTAPPPSAASASAPAPAPPPRSMPAGTATSARRHPPRHRAGRAVGPPPPWRAGPAGRTASIEQQGRQRAGRCGGSTSPDATRCSRAMGFSCVPNGGRPSSAVYSVDPSENTSEAGVASLSPGHLGGEVGGRAGDQAAWW